MTSHDAIAFVAGVLTSIALEVIPGVRERWARQEFKRLILLLSHLLAPMLVWVLTCFLNVPVSFDLSCELAGLYRFVFLGVSAFAGNQTAYLGTQNLPNVRARHVDD